MIGIIGAMGEEIQILLGKSNIMGRQKIANMSFTQCRLNGKDCVLVVSGIGKVNAAVCTQILISDFSVDRIINTGVAGAVDKRLDIGDIVISSDLIEYDVDTSVFGDKQGVIPRMETSIFEADATLVDLSYKSGCDFKDLISYKGRILSGDRFVADKDEVAWLKKEFSGMAVEMEGAAIAHTCYLNHIPFVVIRSISDRADDKANFDYDEFLHFAAEKASRIILDVLDNLYC
jgi:adenosylhomocysteine nucleosidase